MTLRPSIRTSYVVDTDDQFVRNHISNIKSDLIKITEDKLENILLKHVHKLNTDKRWIAPTGIGVSLGLANLTTDFTKTKLGLSPYVWKAMFIILFIASVLWLVITLFSIWNNRGDCSIASLISRIKQCD